MKIKINRYLRRALIYLLCILIFLCAFLIFYRLKNHVFKEEKSILFSYDKKADLSYRVFLKPNVLYSDKFMDEGDIYITNFVDTLSIDYSYSFSAQNNSDIKGSYSIVSLVEGYTVEKDKEKIIWKKQFNILPVSDFNVNDKTFALKKNIQIKLDDYNRFIKQVIESSEINSYIKLTVFMDVDLKADTGNGIIEDNASPSVSLPLNTNYFEISKNGVEEKPVSIEKTVKVELPVNKREIIGLSCFIIFLIAALLYLIFLTGETNIDIYEKKLKRIFKNHGSRLVALNADIKEANERCYKVNSMDDLVKISDEIGKPIMYNYKKDLKQIDRFYTIDDFIIYIFDLKESVNQNL